MYLITEGVIYPDTPASLTITPHELSKRQASYTLRKKLLKDNPNLFISKTRLSIRNLVRGIDDKTLKYLARFSVIEFWKQVENGDRVGLEAQIIESELKQNLQTPSRNRKIFIKQAKIVRDLERIDPITKLGRSKGYGFIEFESHADAICCLRWLNNNKDAFDLVFKNGGMDHAVESKQRPIVEFAMENNLVIKKRNERIVGGDGDKKKRDFKRGKGSLDKEKDGGDKSGLKSAEKKDKKDKSVLKSVSKNEKKDKSALKPASKNDKKNSKPEKKDQIKKAISDKKAEKISTNKIEKRAQIKKTIKSKVLDSNIKKQDQVKGKKRSAIGKENPNKKAKMKE